MEPLNRPQAKEDVMANRSYIRFMREKGKGGPWTIGFVHSKKGIVNFCTHTRRVSEFEFMPGRFGPDGAAKKYTELYKKGLVATV
jgi:hypothetical protein